MDRETLDTLCRSFAAGQSSAGSAPAGTGVDPVPEILRSFRLAEISAAELESLLGLVSDAEAGEDRGPSWGLALAGLDDDLDGPSVLVDEFPDVNAIVGSGFLDDDDDPVVPAAPGVFAVRISPAQPGAGVFRRPPQAR